MHETYETTANELNKLFPQNKSTHDIVRNLKRSHNISWRRVENGRNDTYVFFVEPTIEELMTEISKIKNYYDAEVEKRKNITVQLTSAESNYQNLRVDYKKRKIDSSRLTEENTQLKSDLFYSKRSNNILFRFAI